MAQLGLFTTFTPKKDTHAQLTTLLRQGQEIVANAQGCRQYTVGLHKEKIHVFELWDSPEDHKASLKVPEIKEHIKKAMPLISGSPKQETFEV